MLQPLDVGVFRSLKLNYSLACKKYLSDHPGQVITTDIVASLLAQAWPESVTPVNVISGFRKCGIYPLNPGEITIWMILGYDLDHPEYTRWLKAKNFDASDDHTDKTSVSESAKGSSTPSVVSTCAPNSDHASLTASGSVSTSDILDDLLTLPQPKVAKEKENKGLMKRLPVSLMIMY